MKILYIEDNDIKFDIVKTKLERNKKIELIQAKCGNEGLQKLSKEEFELLILDMSLPMNAYSTNTNMLYGEDILEEIKRTRNSIKVFVITGFDFFEHEREKLTYEELYKRLKLNYKKNLIGMVRYDQLSMEWVIELNDIINKIANG